MIRHEKEVLDYLNIPSVPKRKWDGKSGFKDGVAVTALSSGEQAYAVATFDEELDDKPYIKKAFTLEQFKSVDAIYVVPNYMDLNVNDMDLDETSKKAANALAEEVNEMESESEKSNDDEELKNVSEYFFDNITNDDEAAAYIRAYNKRNRIKGRIPKGHDALRMKLYVIWKQETKKNK